MSYIRSFSHLHQDEVNNLLAGPFFPLHTTGGVQVTVVV